MRVEFLISAVPIAFAPSVPILLPSMNNVIIINEAKQGNIPRSKWVRLELLVSAIPIAFAPSAPILFPTMNKKCYNNKSEAERTYEDLNEWE